METKEKQELLAQAIANYPIGTNFHPVNSNSLIPVLDITYTIDKTPYWNDDVICAAGNLYCKGVWATKLGETTVINDYNLY